MHEPSSITINILANSIAGPMSGGDRIWIECAKRWTRESAVSVNVFTTEEGVERGQEYGLTNVHYVLWPSSGQSSLVFTHFIFGELLRVAFSR